MAKKPTKATGQPKKKAYIVSGKGTDDEIRARCAESVEGWDTLRERGRDDMVRLMRRFEESPSAPRLEVTKDEAGDDVGIGPPEGANVTLVALRTVEAFATTSQELSDRRVTDLANYFDAASNGNLTTELFGSGVAFVHGVGASNPVEATLAVQMAATHDMAMRLLGRVGRAQYVDQIQLFGNLANKLLNTFARQAEALAKLQRGGEQVVKHIHLDNRGGQAIVTDTVVTGGVSGRSGDQPYGADLAGVCAALPGPDPLGQAVSVPGHAGAEALSPARGSVTRGTQGE